METFPESKEQLQEELARRDEEIWDIRDHLYERMIPRAAIANLIKDMK